MIAASKRACCPALLVKHFSLFSLQVMKKLLFFVFPLVAHANATTTPDSTGGATSQEQQAAASSAESRQERKVPVFSSITATDGIRVHVRQGEQTQVDVETSSSSLSDKVKTVVEEGVLRVYFDASQDPTWKGLVGSSEEFHVYVTVDDLQVIHASKGAAISFDREFTNTHEVTVALASGAGLTGQLSAKAMNITMRGGSQASIRGAVEQLNVRVTEGSTFKSAQLQVQECIAYASSASRIQLFVTQSLEAKSVNEAVIRYAGKGKLKTSSTEQGGEIGRM